MSKPIEVQGRALLAELVNGAPQLFFVSHGLPGKVHYRVKLLREDFPSAAHLLALRGRILRVTGEVVNHDAVGSATLTTLQASDVQVIG